jgi:hypothetical protein
MKTLMAMYIGDEPLTGKPNQPFYFGEVPVVQSPVQAAKQAIELSREPLLYDYVIRTSGGFFVTPQFAVGIMPGTSFMLTALADSVADPLLAGVKGYMVKEIDYNTYQRVLVQASREADVKACAFGDAVEHAYLRFFGIDIMKLNPTDKVELIATIPEKLWDTELTPISLNINRIMNAKSLERLLIAAAMFQDIAKELFIDDYSIVIYLHTTEKGEPHTAILYSYEAKKETDESTNRVSN